MGKLRNIIAETLIPVNVLYEILPHKNNNLLNSNFICTITFTFYFQSNSYYVSPISITISSSPLSLVGGVGVSLCVGGGGDTRHFLVGKKISGKIRHVGKSVNKLYLDTVK